MKILKRIKVNKTQFFLLLVIFALGLVVFMPLFSTAIFGDDRQLLWISKAFMNPKGTPLHTVANSYLFEILIFNLMTRFFGCTSIYYYAFSFVLRVAVSYTLFWFLKKRNLSDTAAFLGGLIFIVSPIGSGATIMIRNFDSYLGMIILLVTLDILIRFNDIKKYIYVIILSITALLINTIRSPGIFVIVCSVLLAKIILPKSQDKKGAFLTLIFLVVTFFVAYRSSLFGGQQYDITNTNFPLEFFYSFFGNVGRTIIPHLSSELIPFLIISCLFLIWKREYFFQKNVLSKILGILEISTITYIGINLLKKNADFANSFLIGLYFIINFVYTSLVAFLRGNRVKFINNLIVLTLAFSFIISPNLRQPYFHADSDHRYLIYAALLVPIMISYSIQNLLQENKIKITIGLSMLFLLFLSFAQSSSNIITLHHKNHSVSYTNTVWNQLKSYLDKYDLKHNKVEVILLTDIATYSKVSASVYFGFSFHTGLIYEIQTEDQLPTVYFVWTEELLEKHLQKVSDPSRKRVLIEIIDSQVREIPLPISS